MAISFLRGGFPRQCAHWLGMTFLLCSGGLALESGGESPLTIPTGIFGIRYFPNPPGIVAAHVSSAHSTAKTSPEEMNVFAVIARRRSRRGNLLLKRGDRHTSVRTGSR